MTDETAPDPFDDVLAPQRPDRTSAPKKRTRRDADDPFVTDLRQAWQRGGRPLTRHRDGLALQGAVGPDAANRRHDMATLVAAERARPDLDKEGGEPEGGESETPDNEPQPDEQESPFPRPEVDVSAPYAYDIKDAENALAPKARELWEVNNEIRENGFKLQDLKTLQAEFRELGDDTLPWRALDPDDPKFKKLLKTVAKWSDLAHIAKYLVKFSTKPHNPFTLGGDIAELEARQVELGAQREELQKEVDALWDGYLEANAEYQACLAEHNIDPEAPSPGPDEPNHTPTA